MRQMFISLLLSLFAFASKAEGQVVLPQGYQQLDGYPYIICVDDVENKDIELTDAQFDRLATGVQFQVNRTDIDPQSDFFRLYSESLLPLLKREDLVLVKLLIRGAASPEGPYENNRRLGRGRTENLLKLITDDLSKADLPNIKVETQAITEDYRYLVNLMEQANDVDAAEVKAMFEQCEWDEPCCKKNLQKMRGGTVWNRLLKQYFPRLRSSRIVLFLKHADVIRKSMGLMIDFKPMVFEPVSFRVDSICPIAYDFSPLDSTTQETQYTRRHLLAVRTNLLRDFFVMPQFGFAPGIDIQLEYYPKNGHLTYNAAFTWTQHRRWDSHKFFQIRDAQLEVRRYFHGGGVFVGPYLGVYAQGGCYGIGLSDTKGWEGEHWGAGLDLGWVMKLNKKGNFRLEFNISAGYLGSVYDPYVWGNPITNKEDGKYYYDYHGTAKSFRKRNHLFTWFGPTNVGINLTYDILYRKKTLVQKGGMR